MAKKQFVRVLKRVWRFIWVDESIWSWLVNIVLAFVIIKFLVYPGLGFALQTSHPIVAVVSGSMEHGLDSSGLLCGKEVINYKSSFDGWWLVCGDWYVNNGVSRVDFERFSFRNGFNTGDIMVLYGTKFGDVKIGQIIVFSANRPDPIIHRVVKRAELDGVVYLRTKGDHNDQSYFFEQGISADKYVGRAVLRIPLLGYVKIWFVKFVGLFTMIF